MNSSRSSPTSSAPRPSSSTHRRAGLAGPPYRLGRPLDPAEASPTPLRFPGQYADAETGLSYNLARYYDPETGRYASQDPLGLAPAPNPNAYVANPNELVDPLGLAPCAADQARGWQGSGNYPRCRPVGQRDLAEGTVVARGGAGVSGFFASDASAAKVGSDARALNEGRRSVRTTGPTAPDDRLRLTEDTPAARAIARRTPVRGRRLEQFFIRTGRSSPSRCDPPHARGPR